MSELVFGLYFEGSTDESFLSSVIRRITTEILVKYDRGDVWSDIILIPVKPQKNGSQEQKILAAATEACGYHLLIVHADADAPTSVKAHKMLFDPGLKLVRQAGESACQDLLPIIPIQEMEAWLLTDKSALLKELGTNKSASELGIPPLRQIESIAQPKERLEHIVRLVNQSRPRSRPIERGDLYEPMGKTVSLAKLAELSACQLFISDLTEVLIHLGVIPYKTDH